MLKKKTSLSVVCLIVTVGLPTITKAETPTIEDGLGQLLQTFSNPPGDSSDFFALDVAVSKSGVLVASRLADVGIFADDVGTTYLFDEINGGLKFEIPHPEPSEDDEFGFSISTIGNDLLVGAYGNDFGARAAGSAYLFDGITGQLKRTIRNPSPALADVFGYSVTAIGTDYAIGAIGVDGQFEDEGEVYVFDGQTGQLRHTLRNPNPRGEDEFGTSLAESRGNIVVGSRFDRVGNSGKAGSVYVFDGTTGQMLSRLVSSNPTDRGEFGWDVTSIDEKIIVGAPNEKVDGVEGAGAVYVFDAVTGLLDYRIPNPGLTNSGENFGYSVDVAGKYILVGAPRTWSNGIRSGAAYLFDIGDGSLVTTLLDPTEADGNLFGISVAGTNQIAVIGSPRSSFSGKVYVFSAVPEPSSFLLAALGILGLVAFGWRKLLKRPRTP